MASVFEISGCLFRADKILYAEGQGNDVVVTIEGMSDDEVTVPDCTLSRFKEAWVRALKYGA